MADLKTKYGTGGQPITITLESLVSGTYRESDSISNATDLWDEIMISGAFTLGAGTPAGDKGVYVYAYGAVDGAVFTDGALGSDGLLVPTSPTNLLRLGFCSAPTAVATFFGGPWSLARAFGGSVPATWGVVVYDASGVDFTATVEKSYLKYQGICRQTV